MGVRMTPGRRVQSSGFRVQRQRFRVEGNSRHPDFEAKSLNPELSTMNQQGFTFIEMMIVLVIIGILLSIAQPGFSTSVRRAREATLQENLFIFRDVIDQYYADHSEYPPTLEALVEARYLRKVPKDPITGSETTWGLVYDTNENEEEEGIFDVYSGSDLIGLDGTPYQDW